MLNTIALAGVLALLTAQEGSLSLSQPRITFGELGPTRPNTKLLPGDIFFVAFDIQNISLNPEGKFGFSVGMEVRDKDGKPVFEQKPVPKSEPVPLGGTTLPAKAYLAIPVEQDPGVYTCKITVIDQATKASESIEQQFEVLPAGFGVVGVYTTADPQGFYPAPPFGKVGENVWVHFGVVGFQRDPNTKQPNFEVTMTVLDAGGQPVGKPTSYPVNKEVEEKERNIQLRFFLPMNRPGKFKLQLDAKDGLSGKTSTVLLPVTVAGNSN